MPALDNFGFGEEWAMRSMALSWEDLRLVFIRSQSEGPIVVERFSCQNIAYLSRKLNQLILQQLSFIVKEGFCESRQ